MKAINRYPLKLEQAVTSLKLRAGFRVVHCEYVVVEKAMYLWIEEPLGVDIPIIEAEFKTVECGSPVANNLKHIATAVDTFSPKAYHVYGKLEHLTQSQHDLAEFTAA